MMVPMSRPKAATTPLTRSQHMGRIRGTNTTPERILRALLWSRGLRYRIHRRVLSTRPDLVFQSAKIAIFIDGCFWHGCPEHYSAPRSRKDFWSRKLNENVLRDARQTRELVSQGWCVLRFLAHEVLDRPEAVADVIEACLRGDRHSSQESWRVLSAQEEPGEKERQELVCLQTAAQSVRISPRARNTVRRSRQRATK